MAAPCSILAAPGRSWGFMCCSEQLGQLRSDILSPAPRDAWHTRE